MVQADSPYFKIVAPLNSGDKVGPGLPTVYKIQFTPEDQRVSIKITSYIDQLDSMCNIIHV